MLALLLAQASAMEAERAFAQAAERQGQWTAFRAYAAPDATMFTPQPVSVATYLKDRRDPPQSVAWTPTWSFVSCDRRAAVNTGPWIDATEAVGYFTTVWVKQADGAWKWTIDAGDRLDQPRRPVVPTTRTATCGKPGRAPVLTAPAGGRAGEGASPDGTLQWSWTVAPDGARRFVAQLWTGVAFEPVIDDRVAPPPPPSPSSPPPERR